MRNDATETQRRLHMPPRIPVFISAVWKSIRGHVLVENDDRDMSVRAINLTAHVDLRVAHLGKSVDGE